ncbi:MAG: hypothetical protein K8S27_12560 [Candidatus Omnitrophica bacterium]|nr:hypothetical protein [Candidatus Omnitrophota bacterium]
MVSNAANLFEGKPNGMLKFSYSRSRIPRNLLRGAGFSSYINNKNLNITIDYVGIDIEKKWRTISQQSEPQFYWDDIIKMVQELMKRCTGSKQSLWSLRTGIFNRFALNLKNSEGLFLWKN